MRTIKLHRYNKITGYWSPERICDDETADEWLDMFRKDEPHESFILARIRPSGRPEDMISV